MPDGADTSPGGSDPIAHQAFFDRLDRARWREPYPSLARRLQRLQQLESSLLSHRKAMESALWEDFHKPPFETSASELLPCLVELRRTRRRLGRWMKSRRVPTPWELSGTQHFVHPEPKGVVLILSPWNYPINLCITPLVAAWAAGNRVVIKPSEFTPATSAVIAKAIREAFGEDEVAVVQGDSDAARNLLQLPFDHVFFTGSIGKAIQLMETLANRLTPVTLELGGKSPVIIAPGANIGQAVRNIAYAKCLNAGQTCIAPDFVLLHEGQLESFCAAWKAALHGMYGSNPMDHPDYCGIVNAQHFERLQNLLRESVRQGAKTDIEPSSDPVSRKFSPCLLLHSDWQHASMKEEIFGPVLPVITYRNAEDLPAQLRALPVPLSLYIFDEDQKTAKHLAAQLRSGGVSINNCLLHYCNFDLPFGGRKESGMGVYHGIHGFETFSHLRSVSVQGKWINLLRLFHPPYAPWKKAWMERIIQFIGKI
ncbi:MAG: aldehyde dehydrogenase family protein [Saprospiraceae bacterium]|jgi:aldehyde dehydrogenase (NAD+)|nr:aldehyde dehydrogenase family protein [Saprospiraceae bacterium]MBP9210577.1 aldehyde dehydrogenase family protein [Saprospiraceae bacterium]MBV6473609.1 Aldehyde dehydrogenase [Saprospiraceae bacterium]